MEVHLLTYSIRVDNEGFTTTFLGTDLLWADYVEENLQIGFRGIAYTVRLFTTHRPEPFLLELRNTVDNHKEWANSKKGAQLCLDTISPYIRLAIPSGASVSPKNSIEFDSGQLQLVGDEATPAADYYYGTDAGGVRGFFPLPSAGALDFTTNPGYLTVYDGATPYKIPLLE